MSFLREIEMGGNLPLSDMKDSDTMDPEVLKWENEIQYIFKVGQQVNNSKWK